MTTNRTQLAERQIDLLGPIGDDARQWMVDRYLNDPHWAASVDMAVHVRSTLRVFRSMRLGVA